MLLDHTLFVWDKRYVKYLLGMAGWLVLLYSNQSMCGYFDSYHDRDALIKLLVSVTKEVGNIIVGDFESVNYQEISMKTDNSVLTATDERANEKLFKLLKTGFLEKNIAALPIITEESPVDLTDREKFTLYIQADPVDGSSYLVKMNERYKVQEKNVSVFVAIMEKQEDELGGALPRYGIIHCPFFKDSNGKMGLTLYGGKGLEAMVELPDGAVYKLDKIPQINAESTCEVVTSRGVYEREKIFLCRLGMKYRNEMYWPDIDGDLGLFVSKNWVSIEVHQKGVAESQIDRYCSLLNIKEPGKEIDLEKFMYKVNHATTKKWPVLHARVQKSDYAQQEQLGEKADATEEFDVTAFCAIYRACGGSMIDYEGREQRFNKRNHFKMSDYMFFPNEDHSVYRSFIREGAWSAEALSRLTKSK